MRWIESLSNSGAVQTALDAQELGKPYMVYLEDEHRIDWNTLGGEEPEPPYSAMPLTFKITSPGNIRLYALRNVAGPAYTTVTPPVIIDVYKNGVYETTWAVSQGHSSGQIGSITADTGDVFEFYAGGSEGKNYQIGVGISSDTSYRSSYSTFSGSTAGFVVEGNIMSLINAESFSAITSYTDYYNSLYPSSGVPAGVFTGLFRYCTGLTSAEHLILPTDAAPACYANLFKSDSALVAGPVLPAQVLYSWSYGSLYSDCGSLSTVTMLGESSIGTMWGDTWLYRVANTGTFYKSPFATTSFVKAPAGWTIEDADI